jgi:hypothetical protein
MHAIVNRYHKIPPTTMAALLRYVNKGYMPGHFLTAVLTNDLFEAVGQADVDNIQALPEIVKFVYTEVPGNAWGSKEAVREYSRQRFDNPEVLI